MRLRLALVSLIAVAACRPIRTEHGFDLAYPTKRTDFTARWIGTPSGRPALWITTANDGEENGRYEGLQLIIDPGTPDDVESTVLPWLVAHGLTKGAPVRYVVSTTADPQRLAGAERLARELSVKNIAGPALSGPRGRTRDPRAILASFLDLGPEITARFLVPPGTEGSGLQTLAVRFIDTQILVLPKLEASAAGEYTAGLERMLEREGLHATIVSADPSLPASALAALMPEVLVGPAPDGVSAIGFAAPAAGRTLEITTNGSEISAPGGRHRSRFGHWIDCHELADPAHCEAALPASPAGPLVVTLEVAGKEGAFLVDTRAPLSFLATPRFQSIPGWEKAETGAHGHGSEAIGLEVPGFTLGPGGPAIRRWHVLPCEPFSIGERPIAGVIGMDLLQSFRLTITHANGARTLLLAPNFDEPRESLGRAVATDAGGWDIPLDYSPAGPLLLATLDAEPHSLILDLASAQSAVFVRPSEFDAKVKVATDRTWQSFDVEGDLSRAEWKKTELRAGELTIADLNLFGAHFPGTKILAVDHPLGADLLGMDFVDGFATVELDFRRRSLKLIREPSTRGLAPN